MKNLLATNIVFAGGLIVAFCLFLGMILLPMLYHEPMTASETEVHVVISHAFTAVIGFLFGGYTGARVTAAE